MSAFVLQDGVVYHTYSAYARGVDGLWGMFQWLDRAPKGRNETGRWYRLNDEYDNETAQPDRCSRRHVRDRSSGRLRLDAYRQRQVNVAGPRSESNAEGDNPMSLPTIVSREEWLIARKQLLTEEKEATRLRDAVNADRRRLPMVEVVEDYAFEGADGQVGLLDLFEGRHQLIVDHFMWPDLDSDDGCPSCAGRVDQYGNLAHLHARDTTIAVVSRAPLKKVEPFKQRMGWTFPWYSSHGSDFNYDYHVTLDESVAPLEYNYRNKAEFEQAGFPPDMTGDLHGTSVFLRDDNRSFTPTRPTGAARSRWAAPTTTST